MFVSNQRDGKRLKTEIIDHRALTHKRHSCYTQMIYNGDILVDRLRKKKRNSTFGLHLQIQKLINTECNQIKQKGILLTSQINSSINHLPNDIQCYKKNKIKDPYILTIKNEIKVLKKEIEEKGGSLNISNAISKRKKTIFLSQQYNDSHILNTKLNNKENKYIDINTFEKTIY